MKLKTILISTGMGVALVAALWAQSSDAGALAKIRSEGMDHSQAENTMFWIADAGGPRLTGSPAFEKTGDWVVKQLQDWGVSNVHKERWAFGKGWTLNSFTAVMHEPDNAYTAMPLIALPEAWSPATNGLVTAPLVYAEITSAADFDKYRGKLHGAIILTQPFRPEEMLHGPFDLLYTPEWVKEMMTPDQPGAGRGRGGAGRGRGGRGGAAGLQQQITAFYKSEGVVALFNRGGNSQMASGASNLTWMQEHPDGGTLFVQAVNPRDGSAIPTVVVSLEQYNRMLALVQHNVPVTVDLNLAATFNDEPAGGGGFNIVGEIPGTDPALKSQVVMVGAHFDSWHGADGATDNGTGSTAMMEVMRIIKAAGLHPRRTIRIGLWGGEEEGELGSHNYVTTHKAELDKDLDVYFNLDNGTGMIRGVWEQDNTAVAPLFAKWAEPVKDLGVDLMSPRAVQSTDHSSFDNAGLPGFQFVQERREYNSRTHHSNMDLVANVHFDWLKQQATVTATFVWEAAQSDERVPRKPAPPAPAAPAR